MNQVKKYRVTINYTEEIYAETEDEAFEIFWDEIRRKYEDFEQENTEVVEILHDDML